MKKRPVDYFHMFYADTALFGADGATRCGIDFFGFDKVLFASDVPFEPTPGLYIRETIRILDAMDITSAQRQQIYHDNALKFLKPAKILQAI